MRKRVLSILLALCMVLTLLPATAWAADIVKSGSCGDNATWTQYSDGTLVISGTGVMKNYSVIPTPDSPWSMTSSIKTVKIEEGIVNIGSCAFGWMFGLTTVEIPKSVVVIGSDAFNNSRMITKINYAGTESDWDNIEISSGNYMLSKDKIQFSSGDSTDKSGTCGQLNWRLSTNGTLTISGLGDMPDYDPYDMGYGTAGVAPWYKYKDSIKSVIIEDGITSVGNCAFFECKNITDASIPDGVTTIGRGAFWRCSNLSKTKIPDSVTSIGDYAFAFCIFPEMVIPDKVISIGYSAFGHCDKMSHITIPESVRTIGDAAFYECYALASIVLPGGVSQIGEETFTKCQSLSNITIPSSVTEIGPSAFHECVALKDVYFEGSEDEWKNVHIGTKNEPLTSAEIHCNDTEDPNPPEPEDKHISGILRTGSGCRVLWQLSYQITTDGEIQKGNLKIFTSSTDTVAEEIFLYNETSETGFPFPWETEPYNIPKSAITRISINGEEKKQLHVTTNAFRGYDQLQQVTLRCVSGIDANAFEGCTSLGAVSLSDGITTVVGKNAFRNCSSLQIAKLGNSIKSIGDGAFIDCPKLTIHCYQDSVAHQYAVKNNIPVKLNRSTTVQVPLFIAGRNITMDIKWVPSRMFSGSSGQYDNDLAIAGLALSGASESGQDTIAKTMTAMGFQEATQIHLMYDKPKVSEPAVSIGRQSLNVGGEQKALIAVVVRGTTSNADVVTDLKSVNDGFSVAGRFITSAIEGYINQAHIEDDIILFITGHSLGGAATDHAAYAFNSKISRSNVFAYTFAAPRNQSIQLNQSNIHNVINKRDIVPYVPPNYWGRAGMNYVYTTKDNLQFDNAYKELCGEEPSRYLSQILGDHQIGTYMALLTSESRLTVTEEFGYRLVKVHCPVDVSVYGSNGQLVGRVINNVADESIVNNNVYIAVYEDEKYIYLLEDEPYSIELTGTADGNMEYSVQDFNLDDKLLKEKIFTNVKLTPDKKMSSEIGRVNTSNVRLLVLDTTGRPEKEVLSDGNGTEIPITPTEPKVYTITFDPTGGMVNPATLATGEDGRIITMSTPTRDGFSFEGWYTAADGGEVITTETVFTKDTVIYAHWKETATPPTPEIYTITFDPTGGVVTPTTSTTDANGKLTILPTPTREGYTFDGWYTSADIGEKVTTETVFTADTTVYAHWKENTVQPNPDAYTVTFNGNGGTVIPAAMTTNSEGKLPDLPTPSRSSHIFNGWYTVDGIRITTSTVFRSDTTVYAHWTYVGGSSGGGGSSSSTSSGSGSSSSYSIFVADVNGGTVSVKPKSATKGSTVTITAIPDTGYELMSVTVTERGENAITLSNKGSGKYNFTMPGNNVTITAAFQPIPATELNAPVEAVWSNPYIDVASDAWYYNAVKFVSENSLMNGTSSNIFAPDAQLSRAMLAQILYNKAGKPGVSSSNIFTDVENNAWYTDAITWAAENHIVTGYGDGKFNPNDKITREQLAVMLWRYAGEPVATTKELRFTDASIVSSYALEALYWATENKIINGSNSELMPKGNATRAQVAQTLSNYLK